MCIHVVYNIIVCRHASACMHVYCAHACMYQYVYMHISTGLDVYSWVSETLRRDMEIYFFNLSTLQF